MKAKLGFQNFGSLFDLQGLPNPCRKLAEMCPAVKKKLVDQRKELYCEYGMESSTEMDCDASGAKSCEDVLKLIVTTNKIVEAVVDKFPLLKMWMRKRLCMHLPKEDLLLRASNSQRPQRIRRLR